MNTRKGTAVFVKLDEYQEVKDVLKLIKSKLNEAKYFLKAVDELKKKEDAEIEGIHSELSQINEKVGMVDHLLTDPGM